MPKSEYYDDPESYWEEKKERQESDGKERLERWERRNPNHVYGQSEVRIPKE
jgi:hypothetical protein